MCRTPSRLKSHFRRHHQPEAWRPIYFIKRRVVDKLQQQGVAIPPSLLPHRADPMPAWLWGLQGAPPPPAPRLPLVAIGVPFRHRAPPVPWAGCLQCSSCPRPLSLTGTGPYLHFTWTPLSLTGTGPDLNFTLTPLIN